MTVSIDTVPRGDVLARLNFYKDPTDGRQPFNYVNTPPPGEPQSNYGIDEREVLIEDLRGREHEFSGSRSLDRHAFAIVEGDKTVSEPTTDGSPIIDWDDPAAVSAGYYPEVERLLREEIPGTTRVVIFDHTVRRAAKAGNGDDKPPRANTTTTAGTALRGPVNRVHIDQTAASAAMRVRRHVEPPAAAEQLLQHSRYRIINVWRPLDKHDLRRHGRPVASFPLAFASSASVADGDVVPVQHHYANGYSGFTAGIRYPDKGQQKWYYLSGMTADERLLLECFDSEALTPGSAVAGGRVPHTAFEHARTPADAEGRESIEVRALVFSEPTGEQA